jgi:hypothetical protein
MPTPSAYDLVIGLDRSDTRADLRIGVGPGHVVLVEKTTYFATDEDRPWRLFLGQEILELNRASSPGHQCVSVARSDQ